MVSREREGRTVNRAGGGTTAVALAWGRDGGTRGGATQTGSQSMISAAATMAAEQDGGVGVGGLRTTAYTPSKRPPSRRVWRWRRWRGRRRPPPPMRPLCRLFPPQGARGSCAVATAGRAAAARSGHWGGVGGWAWCERLDAGGVSGRQGAGVGGREDASGDLPRGECKHGGGCAVRVEPVFFSFCLVIPWRAACGKRRGGAEGGGCSARVFGSSAHLDGHSRREGARACAKAGVTELVPWWQ